MDSLDDSYLLTGYEPKNYDLMETYVESFTESLTRTVRFVGERTGRPVRPSGQELNVGNAQIRYCWTDRESKFSPNVRRRLRHTNSRLIMTEEMYEN